MREWRAIPTVLCLLLAGIVPAFVFAGSAVDILGVPKSRVHLYAPTEDTKEFSCINGHKRIPIDSVNDDYCDCLDGSDEPGTSACPNSKFYCRNKGHRGRYIFSSRVGDGVCDCCDGSDEPTELGCPNTCVAEAAVYLQQHAEKTQLAKEGWKKKKEYISLAKEALAKKKEELETAQEELKIKLAAKVAAEETKAREEALEEEDRRRLSEQAQPADALGISDFSKEELVDMIVSFTANLTAESWLSTDKFASTLLWSISEVKARKSPDEQQSESSETPDLGFELPDFETDSTTGDANKDEGESEAAAESTPSDASTNQPVESSFDTLKAIFSPAGATERPEAVQARADLNTASYEHSTVEKTVKDLETELSTFYGPDNEYWALKGKCIELKAPKYTYKVCPFDNASQDYTSLGQYSSFEVNEDRSATMVFNGGTSCWNGPARSLKVTFECGSEEVLSDIEEPSVCVYTAIAKTPASCGSWPENLDTSAFEHSTTEHDEL